jgi:D-alanyl-D-alanine carboxypeptidase (penicillin-binding protein 5/6)
MKKIMTFLLVTIIAVTFSFPQVCQAVDTCAKAAVVMDVNTGRILYSKNANTELPMASTTKIMTTIVAIESGKLNEVVKISKNSAGTEGSSIYLQEGEQLTVEELLFGIMLRSGNDASIAVAEYVGGSVEKFAQLMNQKAKDIGALNTSFANPHGLDHPNHYTTARDLALITSYALKNPKFKEIVSTKRKSISGPPTESWDRALVNKNKTLWQYEGGDGVKTGYTSNAGRCLVSSATKDNWQLVCVVLDCRPMWDESSALLNYAYENYENKKVIDMASIYKEIDIKGGKEKTAGVKPTKDLFIPLKKDELTKLEIVPEYKVNNIAPIYKGSNAGALNIYIDKNLLGTVTLEYNNNVESNSPIYYLRKIINKFGN